MPYIEIDGKRYHLQQEVDPHRFEVGAYANKGVTEYFLCPKVKTRYRQATGLMLVKEGDNMNIQVRGGNIVRMTVPLSYIEFIPIQIDWSASSTNSVPAPPPQPELHEATQTHEAQEAE